MSKVASRAVGLVLPLAGFGGVGGCAEVDFAMTFTMLDRFEWGLQGRFGIRAGWAKVEGEGCGWEEGYTRFTLPGMFQPALHPLFEAMGYGGGFAVYRWGRERRGDALTDERRWVVIAAAAVGALVGARALGLLEQAPLMGLHWSDVLRPGGKTIVGGLLGGWLAVEVVKKIAGVRSRTGDLFAVPLCVGIAIGRLGCFF